MCLSQLSPWSRVVSLVLMERIDRLKWSALFGPMWRAVGARGIISLLSSSWTNECWLYTLLSFRAYSTHLAHSSPVNNHLWPYERPYNDLDAVLLHNFQHQMNDPPIFIRRIACFSNPHQIWWTTTITIQIYRLMLTLWETKQNDHDQLYYR